MGSGQVLCEGLDVTGESGEVGDLKVPSKKVVDELRTVNSR